MSAWAKIRARDPATGEMATFRVHLLGTNKEEDKDDGYFYYTFPPDLLAVISQSRAWATIKSHIMYALRSKYSIRLYEMVERRIGLMKQYEVFASTNSAPCWACRRASSNASPTSTSIA